MTEQKQSVSIRNVSTQEYLTVEDKKLCRTFKPYGWQAVCGDLNEGIPSSFWVVLKGDDNKDHEYYLQPAEESIDDNSALAIIDENPAELYISDAGCSDGSFNITDPVSFAVLAIAKDHETPMEPIKDPAHQLQLSFRGDLLNAGTDNPKIRWVIEPFKE